MNEYRAKLDMFEGPLDLLLHLIKEMKIDIHEVKISEITAQYLTYIKAMEDLKLDIASEYLVMAAHLMLIKSKKLLPKEEIEFDEQYEENPEEELIRRLVEYQQYKLTVPHFRKLEEERGLYYTKPPIDFREYIDDEMKLDISYETTALIMAFEKMIRRKHLDKPMPTVIVAEKVTLQERINEIHHLVTLFERIQFSQLFDRYDRYYIVVSFLALLELVKDGYIKIVQVQDVDLDIMIEINRSN